MNKEPHNTAFLAEPTGASSPAEVPSTSRERTRPLRRWSVAELIAQAIARSSAGQSSRHGGVSPILS
jgi:hypothetical protein